ncbi:CoA transferase [Mycobacterium sp. NPDC048908]|uniref:CoA transferase n=1 Tax=Mycobacterium sp. NPDC048908 TaxID=3364292 RepID=UPI00371A74CB
MRIPTAVLSRVRRTADTFGEFTGVVVDERELIAGRASMLGLSPRGVVSAGGATRLTPTADGWCALTLSRQDDIDLVPALIESGAPEPWAAVQDWMAANSCADVTARARLLGLPVAALGESGPASPRVTTLGAPVACRHINGLLVADLSSMWAGPLCGRLLAQAGATVVKVETRTRPDGTRAGPSAFFDWMNTGKLCYAVDLDEPAALLRLLDAADVVIESSRPAALAKRGLGPAPREGQVWLQITGHGADGERADWVAFGDDAAVAGGLVDGTADAPEFCGDAIADPLTGLHAALAVAESLSRGGGQLVELSMAAVAATYAADDRTLETSCSATPAPSPPASTLGADNATVERLLAAC